MYIYIPNPMIYSILSGSLYVYKFILQETDVYNYTPTT